MTTERKFKFDSPEAAVQYAQILKRDRSVAELMRRTVAFQWITLDGSPVPEFAKPGEVALAVASSGKLDDREISRFTVLQYDSILDRTGGVLCDWDMCRIARHVGPPNVPLVGHYFFNVALALDKARESAALADNLPPLNSIFEVLPQVYNRVASTLAMPVVNTTGKIRLANQVLQALPQDYAKCSMLEQLQAARAALTSTCLPAADNSFMVDKNLIHAEAVIQDLTEYLGMAALSGVQITNPLATLLELPNPWRGMPVDCDLDQLADRLVAKLPEVRASIGAAEVLFHDDDLLEAAVDIDGNPTDRPIRVSGKAPLTIDRLAPLLAQRLGDVFKQLSRAQLERMVAMPTVPVTVDGIGKPLLFNKGDGSVTDFFEMIGFSEYPELPTCFLPWGVE
jgi:hypothetical protein